MVKIVYKHGSPFIEINGECFEPVAFRSFRPKPDNISLMTRAGIRLCQLLVSGLNCTNGSPYSLFGEVWVGDGKYDFAPFDRQFEMFRKFAPDAYFNVMLQLDVRPWWRDAHPELFADEQPDTSDSYHHITELALCEEWKRSAAEYLKAFISYAEAKYGDRIFAYSIAAGLSNEWFDRSLYEKDYDRESNRLTMLWREAVGKPDAPAPTIASMEAGESALREPDSDDYKYLELANRATAELVCYFAAEAQQVLRHQKLFGLFYGYTNLDNQVYWNTNGYERAWSSPDIDMLYSPAAYGDCRELSGVSSYQYTVDSIKLCGKLYLHENDHRTALAAFPLENGVMLHDCYKSFAEWREVFRRELANTLSKQSAFWWFDFFGGYFNSPEYERELTLELDIFKRLSGLEARPVAEIAVFVDPMSFVLTKETTKLCTDLVRANIKALHRCGAPFEIYNLSDLPKLDKNRYKLFVFLNALTIPDELRGYIKHELDHINKAFVYAPGMTRGGKLDIQGISELIGLDITEYAGRGRAVYDGVEYGFTREISPLFTVKLPEAGEVETLASYIDGDVASVRSGECVYSALGNLPWQLWRDIAAWSGAHIYDRNGGGLAVDSRFITAYTTLRGDCELTLPRDGCYVDIWSGIKYDTNGKTLKYSAEPGRTMMFVREEDYRKIYER